MASHSGGEGTFRGHHLLLTTLLPGERGAQLKPRLKLPQEEAWQGGGTWTGSSADHEKQRVLMDPGAEDICDQGIGGPSVSPSKETLVLQPQGLTEPRAQTNKT